MPCTCISVDSPDNLFITEGYNLTHNTALSLQLSHDSAYDSDKTSLFFSAEMTRDAVNIRNLARQSGVNSIQIRQSMYSPEDEEKMMEALRDQEINLNLYIDDKVSPTVSYIAAKSLTVQALTGNLGSVYIDYIELIKSVDERYRDNKVRTMEEIIIELKNLAKVMGIPIVVLSQLSRDIELRKTPVEIKMADFKWASMIEQSAEVILGCVWPWKFHHSGVKYRDEPPENYYEIQAIKVREGRVGKVPLYFNPTIGKFSKPSDILLEEYNNNQSDTPPFDLF